MVECLPNVSELSPDEKSELIVRLFAELQFLWDTVETLKNRIDVLRIINVRQDDFRKPQDRGHRRTNFMAHVSQEFTLGAGGCLG